MQPKAKAGFSAEVKRAGWISALTNVAAFVLLAWRFGNAHLPLIGILYPIFPMALGVASVGTLNWRQWRGFRQSMAASFQAVLAIFVLIVILLILGALFAFAWGGPVAFLLVLFYAGAALVLYSAAIFAISLLLACGGGAILYGLLKVMRYAARIGQVRNGGDELKPRPLLPLSL